MINLTKGQNVSLAKADPGMTKLMVGLGWDARATVGAEFDLDGVVLLVGSDGKGVDPEKGLIFYNNTVSLDGAVVHSGDNRSGKGDGDDETVMIDLTKVTPNVERIVFGASIHDAVTRKQTFGMVSNAKIRLVNSDSKAEAARYDLAEDASSEASMVFGELYRYSGEWKFKAIGQGFAGGLSDLVRAYGVSA